MATTRKTRPAQQGHAIAGVGIVLCSHPTAHRPGSASCDLRADGSRRVVTGGSVGR